MSNSITPGPEIDVKDDLYRCVTTNDWWVAEENRPSSAAFKQPDFSTDVVSLAGSPEYTLSRFPEGCGLVQFNYGDAKLIGFIARLERDPDHPDNHAHANVYNSHGSSKRKTLAQKLVEKIVEKGGIIRAPSFGS
jgi:hypothetical protein